MPSEEVEMVRNSLREFLDGHAADLEESEESGFQEGFIRQFTEMGFLTCGLPERLGGPGLGDEAYLYVIHDTAARSPSLALQTVALCSMLPPLFESAWDRVKTGPGGLRPPGLHIDASSGGDTVERGGSLLQGVVGPGSRQFIAIRRERAFLLEGVRRDMGGTKVPLGGLRALGTGDIEVVEVLSVHEFGNSGGSPMFLSRLGPEIGGAMALGMAGAALGRAVEYASSRKAFGQSLSDLGVIGGRWHSSPALLPS